MATWWNLAMCNRRRNYAIDLLSRADRGREMGHLARIHARKNYCANDVIPMYERYYEQVLAGALVARA